MPSCRVLDDALSQYLERADNLGIVAYPISKVCFFKTDAFINQTLMALGNSAVGDLQDQLLLRDPGDNDVLAFTAQNGVDFGASTAPYTLNNWHHAGGVWTTNGSDRHAYLDGANKGTDPDNNTKPACDRFSIGRLNNGGSGVNYFSGKLCLCAVYTIALSDGEMAQLAAGALPPDVQGANLQAYWFDGTEVDTDHENSYDLTPVNSPTWDSEDWPIVGGNRPTGNLLSGPLGGPLRGVIG